MSAVAYVKYDKASSAAAAIEALHETSLCDGRGPMLKVMIAEAPTRCADLAELTNAIPAFLAFIWGWTWMRCPSHLIYNRAFSG